MDRFRLVRIIGGLALSAVLPRLPGQTPSVGIEQQLRSQYLVASVGSNGVVVRAGTIVVVQQDGITALPAPGEYPCNVHKERGRISHSAMCAINYSPSKDSQRPLQVGEKAYLTAIQVKPSEVVVRVQTCCGDANATPFRAAVSFQFPKGYLDSMKLNEIQDAISQIIVPDATTSAQGPDQSQPTQPQGTQQTQVSGLYDVQGTGAQMQLNPDGSFSLHDREGRESPGRYIVNGNVLALTYDATKSGAMFTIQGGNIFLGNKLAWVRHGAGPALTPPSLPATYANAQTPADQLQLNADKTFSLQEAGQAYQGTFVADGNILELNISGGPKTKATIEGNNLTDSGGQTWVLREQSATPAPTEATLRNQDIIDLTKASIDDATILAKIASSKCQFDTSPKVIIQLKNSGVSATVIKAMVSAGK